jgi:hypothetical protein
MSQVANDATLSTITLLIAVNSLLTLVAGYFLREFVRDVKEITKQVIAMDKRLAVLTAVVRAEIKHFSEEDET